MHQDATTCCGKGSSKKVSNNENYQKVRDHCQFTGKYRGPGHIKCNLKFNVHNEIPVVFHKRSNYDYHFFIKELAKGFEEQFECLGKTHYSTKRFCSDRKINKKS